MLHHFPRNDVLHPNLLKKVIAGISREAKGGLEIHYDLFCHAVCYRNTAVAEALTLLREHARGQMRQGKVFRNSIFEPETTYGDFVFKKMRRLHLNETRKSKPAQIEKMKFRSILRAVKLGNFPKPAQKSLLGLISVGTSPGSILAALELLMDHLDDLFIVSNSPIADISLSVGKEEEAALALRNFHRVPVNLNRRSALGVPGCVYLWIKRHGPGCTNELSVTDIVAGHRPPSHEHYMKVVSPSDVAAGHSASRKLNLWMKQIRGISISSLVDVAVSCSDVAMQPTFMDNPATWTEVCCLRLCIPLLCKLLLS